MSSFKLTEHEYGFHWGPATVSRLISDDRYGVLLEISSNKYKDKLEVRVTPAGFIRFCQPNKEKDHDSEKSKKKTAKKSKAERSKNKRKV